MSEQNFDGQKKSPENLPDFLKDPDQFRYLQAIFGLTPSTAATPQDSIDPDPGGVVPGPIELLASCFYKSPTQQETSPGISEQLIGDIREQYARWQLRRFEQLERADELWSSQPDLHDTYSVRPSKIDYPAFTAVEIQTEQDIVRAILQMSYERVTTTWTDFASSPPFMALRLFYSNALKFNTLFEEALQYADTIDGHKLALYSRFEFSPLNETMGYTPHSLITLFTKAVDSQGGERAYVKQKMISEIKNRTSVSVSVGDSDVEYSLRQGDVQSSLLGIGEARLEFQKIADRRSEIVQDRAMFIKPTQGSGAQGVLRLEYDGTTLRIDTKSELPPMFARSMSASLRALYLNGDLQQIESVSDSPLGDDSKIMTLVDGTKFQVLADYRESPSAINPFESYSVDEHTLLGPRPAMVGLLADLKFEQHDAGSFTVSITPERLSDFFIALEFCTIDWIGTPTYAESAIETVLLDGNVWEIRQINLPANTLAVLKATEDRTLTESDITSHKAVSTARYVKMGSGSAIANISAGGSGQATLETFEQALRTLQPGLSEDKIDMLVDHFYGECDQAAAQIQQALSEYFTEFRNTHLPNFPLKTIVVDSVSTDFMVNFSLDDAGHPVKLTPVLVDVNLFYGVSGLESADNFDYALVLRKSHELSLLVDRVLSRDDLFA